MNETNVKYDRIAKVYYRPHDGIDFTYYCPQCHLEHFPRADDQFRSWVIVATFIENGRQTDAYRYGDLDKELNWRLDNGYCLKCGKEAPYMTVKPVDCEELGDFRFCERPARPPEELLKA